MLSSALVFALVVVALQLLRSAAQFPAICASNATKKDAVCCPTPPGHIAPCGSPARGSCRRIPQTGVPDAVPLGYHEDDRLHWPRRFYSYACACKTYFSGYMCQECASGHTGKNCSRKFTRIRRDVKSLTVDQKRDFIQAIVKLKQTPSDYVVLNTFHGADPCTSPKFANTSVFDYLTYIHYYATRRTTFPDEERCRRFTSYISDFAHGGPGFFSWHRAYMLLWEKEIQKVTGDGLFGLPYWDWIDKGASCEVCTDDFLGSTNWTAADGRLSSHSPLAHFKLFCMHNEAECGKCDPSSVNTHSILRKPGADPRYPELPPYDAMEFVMSRYIFDTPNYTHLSGSQSFRNTFEGFVDRFGVFRKTTHNKVHNFMNGSFSVTTVSANDPIFLMHHTFLDKLFEIWFRKNRPAMNLIPLYEAKPGHNRLSSLVGFFPVIKNYHYFQSSISKGYDYDNLKYFFSEQRGNEINRVLKISMIQGGVIVFLLATALVMIKFLKEPREISSKMYEKIEGNMKDDQISEGQ